MIILRICACFAVGAMFAGCAVQTAAVDRANRPLQTRPLQQDTATALKLYVADRTSNAVTVYPDAGNGDVVPLFHISGSRTLLSAPSSLGLDAGRQLYVLNGSSFAVFATGTRGNKVPRFFVSGGATQLSNPQALAVDPSGTTYVTNDADSGGDITVYAAGSNGDRAPIQQIFDDVSLLFVPAGIALHAGTLYVADPGDQTINEYPASANGLTQPTAIIQGLSNPAGIAVDAQGRIYVTDTDSILVYAANANGRVNPLRVISGSLTQLNGAVGLTVHNSEIAVANAGNNSITVYPENGKGDIAPLRQIIGADTGLSGPQDTAVQ